jgi:hypothetical protein
MHPEMGDWTLLDLFLQGRNKPGRQPAAAHEAKKVSGTHSHGSGHLSWTGIQADRGQANAIVLRASEISRADIVKSRRGVI